MGGACESHSSWQRSICSMSYVLLLLNIAAACTSPQCDCAGVNESMSMTSYADRAVATVPGMMNAADRIRDARLHGAVQYAVQYSVECAV